MKKLIVDLDGTLTQANTSDYKNVLPATSKLALPEQSIR